MVRYAITIFLGAFLLFLVQPLIGRYLLPWFGGGAGVWTACLLFFQVMLLAGYAYAHMITRLLSARGQAIAHGVVMLAGLAFLPIIPAETWKPQPGDDPVLRIVMLLMTCLGPPYLALSATGPLLQSWFAKSFTTRSPYRLYALSNVGSLLALLGYPTIVEPRFSRQDQAVIWSAGYGLYVLLCLSCAVYVARKPSAAIPVVAEPRAKASAFQRVMWIILPMVAAILLLSFTARLSEQVAPVPMLWVVPLAVYLLTFILAFEYPRCYHRGVAVPALMLAYGLITVLLWTVAASIFWQIAEYMAVMFVCCMICHGETYRLKPPASGLTGYYLAIATGGALGGAFVALVAPRAFTFNVEFYISLFGTFAALLTALWHDPASWFHRGRRWWAWITLGAAVTALALVDWRVNMQMDPGTFQRVRNFYGSLAVGAPVAPAGMKPVRVLAHGRVIHGVQFTGDDSALDVTPTTYYGVNSGVGIALRNWPNRGPMRIGIVGMGIGTLASYGHAGDVYRFYEINPQVVEIARSPLFTFISKSSAEVQVVVGDARLMLEREEPQRFDLIVLDAFNGDAIPIHLLTTEAFAIYRKHLNDDGAILVNVSNNFLRLHLPLARLAKEIGWEARLFAGDRDLKHMVVETRWVMLTTSRRLLDQEQIKASGIPPNPDTARAPLWTDDHANLFDVLRR